MKAIARTLPVLVLGSLLAAPAMAAGPSVIASIYLPNGEADDGTTSLDASPDALTLEVRQPVNSTFWVGALFATSLGDDTALPGVDVELGNSFQFNIGAQHEFAHRTFGYAYVGYGKAEIESTLGNIDGNGIGWGLGLQFQVSDNMLIDAGYASLFDGDMEDAGGTSWDTSIAGGRVGLGVKF